MSYFGLENVNVSQKTHAVISHGCLYEQFCALASYSLDK